MLVSGKVPGPVRLVPFESYDSVSTTTSAADWWLLTGSFPVVRKVEPQPDRGWLYREELPTLVSLAYPRRAGSQDTPGSQSARKPQHETPADQRHPAHS